MKRVAYLCFQITREGQASFAHVHEIIKNLSKRGWKVELFEPGYSGSYSNYGVLRRLAEFFRIQFKLMARMNEFDLLYIRMHYVIYPVVVKANQAGVPVVIEVNGQDKDLYIVWPAARWFSGIIKWFLKKSMEKADAIVVVTSKLKEWVLTRVSNKDIYVIPNAANSELFKPLVKTKHLFPNPYVIYFGTLTAWQGIDLMLETAKLPEWPTSLDLLIIGDGVKRASVERAVVSNNNIRHINFLPYAELPGVIAGSIASISPQNNEGGRSETGLYPLKVFESLACGIPVIVTDFPGQAELIRDNNCGLVIPTDNALALLEAIIYLYNHQEEREQMGHRGRELIESEHNWSKRAEDTEKVFFALLKNKNE